MVVYQDDFTAYSKKFENLYNHLENIFKKALEYGKYLNPTKCQCGVIEGKLLGHIVSKEGVRIDLERVKSSDNIKVPKIVKTIQSFFGQINFVRIFESIFF